MTEEMAAQIRRLMRETGITQSKMAEILTETKDYTVSRAEMSMAVNCLNSPKAIKIRNDSLAYLTKEKLRQQTLIDIAKEL